jgi:hypothetical protein
MGDKLVGKYRVLATRKGTDCTVVDQLDVHERREPGAEAVPGDRQPAVLAVQLGELPPRSPEHVLHAVVKAGVHAPAARRRDQRRVEIALHVREVPGAAEREHRPELAVDGEEVRRHARLGLRGAVPQHATDVDELFDDAAAACGQSLGKDLTSWIEKHPL